jgi:predicted Rossmann fold nucleotide-binding protein DprA/Smf involved in DNA uptake
MMVCPMPRLRHDSAQLHQGVIDALSKGHQRVDDIMNETGLDASKVLAALGELLWSNHVMVRHGRYRLQATEASVQGAEAERTP